MSPEILAELFVAGRTGRTREIEQRVRVSLDRVFEGPFRIELVDVIETPARAVEGGVLATPTLLLHTADGVRRVAGDLSDVERLQAILSTGG